MENWHPCSMGNVPIVTSTKYLVRELLLVK